MQKLRKARLFRLLVLVVLSAGVLATLYGYFTRPARLRALALRALRNLPIGSIDVGEVTCSPTGELLLNELVVGGIKAPGDTSVRELPATLQIGSARIVCRPLALLMGRVQPAEIELRDVSVAVVCAAADGLDDALAMEAGTEARLLRAWWQTGSAELPRITIEQGDIQVFVARQGQPQLLERRLWRADGRSTGEGYEFRVEQRPVGPRPLAVLSWRAAAHELECAVDWADLGTVIHLVPAGVAKTLHQVSMSGRVRATRCVLKLGLPDGPQPPLQVTALELCLADGRCLVCVDGEAQTPGATPAGEPFLRFSELLAAFDYRATPGAAGTAELAVDGRLRGAPVNLRARLAADSFERWWDSQSGSSIDGADRSGVTLDDIEQAELSLAALELPTVERFAAFIHSPTVAGPIATLLKDYVPRGRMDVRMRLLPRGAIRADGTPLAGLQRLEGEFRPLGTACRYFRFPYQFENATGLVRLAGGELFLEDLQAWHSGAEIHALGRLNDAHSWTGLDLEFRGQNVALDNDLYTALPAEYRELWDTAAPAGRCNVVATVRRPEGSAEAGAQPSEVGVDAQLLGASLALGDGRRLTQADGNITIHGGVVTVDALHGYNGDASVQVEGVVAAGERAEETNLQVEVSAWPLTHAAALGGGDSGEPLPVRFAGHADVSGRVRGAARTQDLTVRITDGDLLAGDAQRPWNITDGEVRVLGAQQELLGLHARQGEAQLELSGLLPDGAAPLNLHLHATTPRIEELFPQFLPPAWSRRVATCGLSGFANVTVELHAAQDGAAEPRQAADVALQVERARPAPLPLELQNLKAELSILPDRFRLSSVVAQCGAAGQVEIRQARDGTYCADGPEAEFALAAKNLAVTHDLLAALPAGLGAILERAGISGDFDADLPRVEVSGGQTRSLRLQGGLSLRNFGFRSGFELTAAEGDLTGVCRVSPDGGVALETSFTIRRGQLAARPIADWHGELLYEPGARWVRLENVEGRICDGVLQGTLWLDSRTPDYELTARLHDLAIAQLLPPPKELPQRTRPGRLAGEVWLRGRTGDAASRSGGGTVRVSGVSFLQTPVLSLVFQQRQNSRASETVDLADVRFRWEGREIVLERIDIRSRDLRLVGTGRWTPADDRLHMTLWAADPELWPRLGMLGELLQSAGQDLVQYRVDGTLAAPKVTAEPLHKLSAALRQLLGEQ